MKSKIIIWSLLTALSSNVLANISLSEDIFKQVPFSSQFSEDGALIRNIDYSSVKKLIPQIENKYGLRLKSRGEAHITVITPPEAKGWFTDKKGINYLISIDELIAKYSKTIQTTRFRPVCIGKQSNSQGNIVFYLVVDSPALLKIRKEIQTELETRAQFSNKTTFFKASDYYPHITIGFVGSDVHGVSKGVETCVEDIIITKPRR